MNRAVWSVLFLSIVCLWIPGCRDSQQYQIPQVDVPRQLLADVGARQQGALLFARHCRECHGTMAEGKNLRAVNFVPPAPDFYHLDAKKQDPVYLFWRISEGKGSEPFFSQGSVMPAFGPHLNNEQIWQLVAYLRHRSGLSI